MPILPETTRVRWELSSQRALEAHAGRLATSSRGAPMWSSSYPGFQNSMPTQRTG
jgi:hypothetical protein